MNAHSLNADADLAPAAPVRESEAMPSLSKTLWALLLRLVVIALGVSGGWILANIVALFAGWIRFGC